MNHPLKDDFSDAKILIRDEGIYWSSGFIKGFLAFKMEFAGRYPFDTFQALENVKRVLHFWNDNEEDFTDDDITVVDERVN